MKEKLEAFLAAYGALVREYGLFVTRDFFEEPVVFDCSDVEDKLGQLRRATLIWWGFDPRGMKP